MSGWASHIEPARGTRHYKYAPEYPENQAVSGFRRSNEGQFPLRSNQPILPKIGTHAPFRQAGAKSEGSRYRRMIGSALSLMSWTRGRRTSHEPIGHCGEVP